MAPKRRSARAHRRERAAAAGVASEGASDTEASESTTPEPPTEEATSETSTAKAVRRGGVAPGEPAFPEPSPGTWASIVDAPPPAARTAKQKAAKKPGARSRAAERPRSDAEPAKESKKRRPAGARRSLPASGDVDPPMLPDITAETPAPVNADPVPVSAPPASRRPAQTQAPETPLEPARRRTEWRGGIILAAGGLTLVAIVAAILGTRDAPPPSPAGGAQATPTTTFADPTTTFGDDVAGTVSIVETFDDLPMDSTLPRPWTIDGDGPARVAALPTSVDRSIRISSGALGAATAACRPTEVPPGHPVHIALDYRLGRDLPQPASLIELRAGTNVVFALRIDASTGRLEGLAAGRPSGSVAPTTGAGSPASPQPTGERDLWHRVEVTLSGSGELAWQAHRSTGEDGGSGSLPRPPEAEPIDTLCILSPDGAPAGWVAVDDLVIEG